jgi:hypothetical protein
MKRLDEVAAASERPIYSTVTPSCPATENNDKKASGRRKEGDLVIPIRWFVFLSIRQVAFQTAVYWPLRM